jgi:hypothetical protein
VPHWCIMHQSRPTIGAHGTASIFRPTRLPPHGRRPPVDPRHPVGQHEHIKREAAEAPPGDAVAGREVAHHGGDIFTPAEAPGAEAGDEEVALTMEAKLVMIQGRARDQSILLRLPRRSSRSRCSRSHTPARCQSRSLRQCGYVR